MSQVHTSKNLDPLPIARSILFVDWVSTISEITETGTISTITTYKFRNKSRLNKLKIYADRYTWKIVRDSTTSFNKEKDAWLVSPKFSNCSL